LKEPKAAMATTLITLDLADGETLQAEVNTTPATKKAAKSLVKAPSIDFAAEVKKVRAVAEQIHSGLTKVDPLPSSFQVAFGITLTADAGIVLAKAGAQASFTVTLTWGK
jgi:transcriptional antiterminator Rof (Rho-off)